MIFSGNAIRAAIAAKALKLEPYNEDYINRAHIDLHLELPDADQEMVVPAGSFRLAKTLEKVTMDESICAFMEGRASLAKRGISIEQSSTFIEPGSDNQMILEIFNASEQDVILTNNQPIAKMFIMRVVDDFK